jgi:hypothetical protein
MNVNVMKRIIFTLFIFFTLAIVAHPVEFYICVDKDGNDFIANKPSKDVKCEFIGRKDENANQQQQKDKVQQTKHEGSDDTPSDIPNIAQLKMRIKQWYEADINKDLRTWYNISVFSLKNEKIIAKELQSSYEEFEKEFNGQRNFGKYKITSWVIKKITLKEKKKDESPTVAVEMDVFVKEAGILNIFKKSKKSDNLTDYWVYVDNSWYWTWRGWPYD